MLKYILQKNNNKGEVALIYVFIILSILIVSAFTLSAIAISTIKGSGTAEYVARAQVASDSYLEKAMFQFHWSKLTDSRCLNTVTPVDGDGTKVTVMVDNGEKGVCPSLDGVVTKKDEKLCVYSFAENHGVQKKGSAGAGDPTKGCEVR
ncbi:MAG: hypothetical protein Q7S57_05570 [bacterium]|nr:hypothetical protein [bacterium]